MWPTANEQPAVRTERGHTGRARSDCYADRDIWYTDNDIFKNFFNFFVAPTRVLFQEIIE